jgi:hypothetical protein
MNNDEQKLSELMRAARPSPSLPPRFGENVWRRIEDTEAPVKSPTWLDTLVAFILRPRFAYAATVVLLISGILLGVHQGSQTARQEAMARYLVSVAPNSLR